MQVQLSGEWLWRVPGSPQGSAGLPSTVQLGKSDPHRFPMVR